MLCQVDSNDGWGAGETLAQAFSKESDPHPLMVGSAVC